MARFSPVTENGQERLTISIMPLLWWQSSATIQECFNLRLISGTDKPSLKQWPDLYWRLIIWVELGQRTVARLITRLYTSTGKQTDHPS